MTGRAPVSSFNKALLLAVFFASCLYAPLTASGAQLTLEHALRSALANNESITESVHRVGAAEAAVTTARGPYDLTLFANERYSAYESLSPRAYNNAYNYNAAKSFRQREIGARQRVITGGTLSVYYTHSDERRFGINDEPDVRNKDYLTVEFVQSLLRGLGDMQEQGAIKNALLSVDNSLLERKIVISQVTLETIRAYWGLVLATESLAVSREIEAMAREVLRREKERLEMGLSRGVDVDRASLAVEQRRYTVLQHERDVAVARERLCLVTNLPAETTGKDFLPADKLAEPKGVVIVPDTNEAKLLALEHRDELRQIEILLKQINVDYDVAKNSALPSLDLAVGFTTSNGNSYLRSAENFRDTDSRGSWYIGVSVSFPLENREARGTIQRQSRLRSIATEQLTQTFRRIAEEVQETLHNLALAKHGIPVAREALRSAQLTMDGEVERFEMGVVNNRDLLASHDALGREKISYYSALTNYQITLAEYAYATGELLEAHAIRVSNDSVEMQ